MAVRPTNADPRTTRPPEPIRPGPCQQGGLTLLATRVRRRRYRDQRSGPR